MIFVFKFRSYFYYDSKGIISRKASYGIYIPGNKGFQFLYYNLVLDLQFQRKLLKTMRIFPEHFINLNFAQTNDQN